MRALNAGAARLVMERSRQSLLGVLRRLRVYLTLIKSLQTGLLLVTGLAGYLSAASLRTFGDWEKLGAVAGSLLLAIGGSTLLNMVYDRDIDALMKRTCARPLPAGLVNPRVVGLMGALTSALGVAWATALTPLYGAVVLAGLVLDAGVYTVWLKRRTPFSVIIGGLSGGMPALAGRALAVGSIEPVGVLLALAVLFWIPTHILTFTLKYADDYRAAGVPTFPAAFGERVTRLVIAIACVLAGSVMLLAALWIGVAGGGLTVLIGLSLVLLALATVGLRRRTERANTVLFRFASLYMLAAMAVLGGWR